MKNSYSTSALVAASLFALSSCTTQEEMAPKPAAAPVAAEKTAKAPSAPAKAKVEKAKGDVGLLDTEKNYMILVTKEGKLVTLDFDAKTKVTQITPTKSKVTDIGLGSSATVTYTQANDKNLANNIEYRPAKVE